MVVLILLLALAMMATGGAAMVFGSPIIDSERGWAMVIAGSVAASSGAILLGLALAAQRLGRIAQETIRVRDRLSHMTELLEESVPPAPAPTPTPVSAAGPTAPPPLPEPALFEPPRDPDPVAAEPTVVGQHSSGGISYTMFSDGSILADTPAGRHRFSSIDELRSAVARG